MSELVTIRRDGPVAWMTFNRPERLNALDVPVAQAFLAAVEGLVTDSALRVIVMTGAGRAFMAGGDLTAFHAAADKPAAFRAVVDPAHAALKLLAEAPQIVIAAVNGAAAGGGLSIALSADLVIAAAGANFSFAYPRVGAPGDCGGTWMLPRLLGLKRALGFALIGRSMTASEALLSGLITEIVPDDDLVTATAAIAARVAAGPPLAQAELKRLMRGATETGYADHLDREAAAFERCTRTADFAEAVEAFLGKRPPVFTGQ